MKGAAVTGEGYSRSLRYGWWGLLPGALVALTSVNSLLPQELRKMKATLVQPALELRIIILCHHDSYSLWV